MPVSVATVAGLNVCDYTDRTMRRPDTVQNANARIRQEHKSVERCSSNYSVLSRKAMRVMLYCLISLVPNFVARRLQSESQTRGDDFISRVRSRSPHLTDRQPHLIR